MNGQPDEQQVFLFHSLVKQASQGFRNRQSQTASTDLYHTTFNVGGPLQALHCCIPDRSERDHLPQNTAMAAASNLTAT